MNQEPAAFSIVVGLDFREGGMLAFNDAARIAKRLPGSQVHLVHVFHTPLTPETVKQVMDNLRLYACEKAAFIGGLEHVTCAIHLPSGDIAHEIAHVAKKVSAHLIVLGTHQKRMGWINRGLATRLAIIAPCSIVLARSEPKVSAPQAAENIEPSCVDCTEAREWSNGEITWCERHTHHARAAHHYSYEQVLPFATRNPGVIPAGFDRYA